MTDQNIRINVDANTKGLNDVGKAVDNIDKGLESVGKKGAGQAVDTSGIQKIERDAKRARDELRKLRDEQDRVQRVEAAQRAIGKIGWKLPEDEVATVADNFQRARKRSRRLSQFDDFEQWLLGGQKTFKNPKDWDAHRRMVFGSVGQRTSMNDGAESSSPDGGGGGGGGSSGGGRGGGLASSAIGGAKAVAGGMLALAGISGLMNMAGQAVGLASEEATGLDAMKRRMGDLGIEFENLRTQVRDSGRDLGISMVEMQRYGQAFTREYGRVLNVGNIGDTLHTGAALGRGYGIDPGLGVGLMATGRRLGFSSDSQGDRRLALMIGDAVNKGGTPGKVDELISAVTSFASQAARFSLSTPNVGAFVGGLSSLTSTGIPGLNAPGDAASLISAADSSVRRGGAAGDASKNFLFMAMARSNPGMTPFELQALQQEGLFGTASGTFGGRGVLSGWSGARGNTTNFQSIRSMVNRMYPGRGGAQMRTATMSGLLGVNYGQAQALLGMDDRALSSSSGMLRGMGIDIGDIKPGGLATIAALSSARGRGDLNPIMADLLRRKDLLTSDKTAITNAQGGSFEDLRRVLAKVAVKYDYEETEGSRTQKGLADINDALTMAGAPLLSAVNTIRDVVGAIAKAVAPGEYNAQIVSTAIPGSGTPLIPGGNGVASVSGGSFVKPMTRGQLDDKVGLYNRETMYDEAFKKYGKMYGVDWRLLKMIGTVESGLGTFPGTREGNKNPWGARGIMQVVYPKGENWSGTEDNIRRGAQHFAADLKRAKGDLNMAYRYYYGGPSLKRHGANTLQYAENMKTLQGTLLPDLATGVGTGMSLTPLPKGSGSLTDISKQYDVNFNNPTITIQTPDGRQVGKVMLEPTRVPKAAGVPR